MYMSASGHTLSFALMPPPTLEQWASASRSDHRNQYNDLSTET